MPRRIPRPGGEPDRGVGYLRATYSEAAEQLQRALGIQGPLPDAVDPMLEPSITVLDLGDPDMLWLRRQTRFLSGQNLNAGGAGNFPTFEFECPAGGGMLMTVRVTVMNPTAGSLLCSAAVTTQLGGFGGAANRSCNADSRQTFDPAVVAPRPVGIVRAVNQAAATLNGPVYQVNQATPFTLPPIVLSPGNTIRVQSLTANVALACLFEWTERQQQPMES